jgi:hypothetical protein
LGIAGKSLDHIMTLKEASGDKDLYDVLKQQKRKQKKKMEKEMKEYKKAKRREVNVFDFINKSLRGNKGMRALVYWTCFPNDFTLLSYLFSINDNFFLLKVI